MLFGDIPGYKTCKKRISFNFCAFFCGKVLQVQKICVPLHPQSRNIDDESLMQT